MKALFFLAATLAFQSLRFAKTSDFSSPARWAEQSSAFGPVIADSRPEWWRGSASIIPPRALSLPHLLAHQHFGLIHSQSCLSLSHQPSLSVHPLILTTFSCASPPCSGTGRPRVPPCAAKRLCHTLPLSVPQLLLVSLRSLNCMCFYCLFPCFCYGCRTSL